MTIPEAKKACTVAAWAAVVSGGLTFVIVTAALLLPVEELAEWADPFIYLDAVLLMLLSIAMFKCSRAAAILLLVHRILNLMVGLSEATGIESARGLLTDLAFLAVFAYAIYGAFTYHRLRKQEDPSYKPVKNIVAVILASAFGSVVVFIGGGLAVIGMLASFQIIPDTAVVAGDCMTDENKELLFDYGLLEYDESVQYFYSSGMTSILEEGQFLTPRRVVVYWHEGEEVFYQDVPYDQIQHVEVFYGEGPYDITTMELYLTANLEEPDLYLFASTERGLDSAFVNTLMQNWESQRYVGMPAQSL